MLKGLIYVNQISERIKYFETNFFAHRSLAISFTNNKQLFLEFEGTKLNYSNQDIDGCEQLLPASLLFDQEIRKIHIEASQWEDQKLLSFDAIADPLATIFYFVSRYEEYLPSVKDQHNRYLSKNSVLMMHFDLKQQNAERIFLAFMDRFFEDLSKSYRTQIQSAFIPTFDIDNTFAFQWKEGWRTWLSNTKDLLKGNKERRLLRRKVQNKEEKDPFDSYDAIRETMQKYPGKIFWLLGDFKPFDKNIAWNHPLHQRLIRGLAAHCEIGLHPSYASNTEFSRLEMEKKRLETILNKPVLSSRQHFLKIEIPGTYERLLEEGFKNDYSLGYAENVGFRAGTAHPFLWFDLQSNSTTNLMIHPFAYMDGTLNEYLKLTPSDALPLVKQLMTEVKTFGGEFSFLWHNESFAESGIWKGWKWVYDESEKFWNEESN